MQVVFRAGLTVITFKPDKYQDFVLSQSLSGFRLCASMWHASRVHMVSYGLSIQWTLSIKTTHVTALNWSSLWGSLISDTTNTETAVLVLLGSGLYSQVVLLWRQQAESVLYAVA